MSASSLPGERIVAVRHELLADHGDRALAGVVEEREAAPLRRVARGDLQPQVQRAQLALRPTAEVVVAERRVERRLRTQTQELTGGNGASARRLRPALEGRHDLPGLGHALDAHEVDPLDVADDGAPHLTSSAAPTLKRMMEAMTVPPFERFYAENRDAVFGHLVRLLGRQRAEDAFQETFLRALRGYDSLKHGRYLRAWVFTIATRVAADEGRKRRPEPAAELDGETADDRPTYAQIEHLADELPEKERAAVVLRYGYDLPYSDIGTALGSSEEAARQAASSGVRRLRRRLT